MGASLFGSRLGSPTPAAASGTAEEIERAVDSGKPVHVYFSTAPLPRDVNTQQLDGLRQFQSDLANRGLVGKFGTTAELNHEVWKAIEHDIAQLDLGVPSIPKAATGIQFSAQPHQERELRDYDKKGKPRYTTRHWIEVTNNGDTDAQGVTFEAVGENTSMILGGGDEPTVIHAGQTRTVTVQHVFAGSDPDVLRIKWVEDGEEASQEFHVG